MAKTKKTMAIIALIAVITLAFTALSLTGCEQPTSPKVKELSGAISISPDSNVTTGTELTAAYDGDEVVSYQWYKDGVAINSATTNKYTPAEAGSYTVTVSVEGYASKTSAPVTVTGKTLSTLSGTVSIEPAENVTVGMELTAEYSGNEGVSYQWNKGGVAIDDETNQTYTPIVPGTYTVTASKEGYVSKTSDPVIVTLKIITSAEIEITAPVMNDTPDTAPTTDDENYTVGTATWSPNDAAFKSDTVYTVTVTLTANTDFTFTGLTTAKINGETATVSNNTGAAVTLSYTFPATDTKAV
ncbi:MAG: hypothetical protein LBQ69_01690, partial [Treponema sp.]|nr:hypothetical protein [Treponema sp.]